MANRTGLEEQVRCVEREIRCRRRVYPRWVEERRMSQAAADHELACMEAVLVTLQQDLERAKPGLFAKHDRPHAGEASA